MQENKEHEVEKYMYSLILACITLMILILISFSVGRYSSVHMKDVINILLYKSMGIGQPCWSDNAEIVIMQLRLPRIIGAVLIGAALAMSGATYQAIFANPIASPDTLGVSNAASFGAVWGIVMGVGLNTSKVIAFVIGCIAVFTVFFAATKISKGRELTIYLLLIGMVVSSVFSALLSVLKYVADPDEQLPQITYWLMGSLSKLTMDDVKGYVVFFLLGAIPLLLLRWRMNLLSLSDAETQSIGQNVYVLRGITIFCATLLTASSTAMTGGISWVGLIIPHMVRVFVGSDFRKILPLGAFVGSIFLLLMDDLSRTIGINELPISIMTSLIGAPLFFFALMKNRGNVKYGH